MDLEKDYLHLESKLIRITGTKLSTLLRKEKRFMDNFKLSIELVHVTFCLAEVQNILSPWQREASLRFIFPVCKSEDLKAFSFISARAIS